MWIILGIIAVVLIAAVGIYNTLVRLRNQVKNAWGQIDVQLQRRYDLIPNLVESVKGYMKHESETLEAVIAARTRAVSARKDVEAAGGATETSLKALAAAESGLGGMLGRLFALSESYPDLKANENMLQLQEELRSTENKVAFSRQAYNDQVLGYNNAQQQFPAVLLASAFGHHEADLFQTEGEEVKKAPTVSF